MLRLTLTVTFSSESGVSMLKAMRMTCAWAYERGRRRCEAGAGVEE